jgi:hypothetical protein
MSVPSMESLLAREKKFMEQVTFDREVYIETFG